MLEVGTTLHGFIVLESEDLPEIDGRAYVLRHETSGARLLYLQNDDENKAFSIAFKTPPADDTGVFHILEHSVLCGSERFPVKEPFVNLLKTSMQTFLNALTFPDKTMYPVASTNEQDLLNLADVYLDAVFHPAIYTNRHIFEQEGWHYELAGEGDDERLVYNGVVFNEMKGAMSNPESVLMRSLNHAMFPGTPYAFESGGDPRSIPQLTYEQFLDEHARHYNAANSYVTLYGDLDIDRMLEFLDERYFRDAPVPKGAPNTFGAVEPVVAEAVERMDTAPENACVGLGYAAGASGDYDRMLACEILLDAIMGHNESPIKRAVLDAGIGGDCTAHLSDEQVVPAAVFTLRNAKPDAAARFREIVEGEAARLAKEGIPRDDLEASFEQMAFSLRERDYGMADGVILSIIALSGWLYNDGDATTYLKYEGPLARLRAGMDEGYFERLLEDLLVDNGHRACVTIEPAETGSAAEEAAELAAIYEGLDEAGREAIKADVEALRLHQGTPDAPEDLAKLPQLHVSDIGPAKPSARGNLVTDGKIPFLHYDLPTRGIAYLRLYFDLSDIPLEDLPYVTLLALLLGGLDTSRRTAAELDTMRRRNLGATNIYTETFASCRDADLVSPKLVVFAAGLSEKLQSLADIPREIWAETRFEDAGRMRDILVQRRIAFERGLIAMGTAIAQSRAAAHLFQKAAVSDILDGLEFYFFLRDLVDAFDERFDGLRAKLYEVRDKVFGGRNILASFTGSAQDCEAFWAYAGDLGLGHVEHDRADGLPLGFAPRAELPALEPVSEAFSIPADVAFTARAGRMGFRSDESVGLWLVAAKALALDYLWNEVRVKGGAYGSGFSTTPAGLLRFTSYRDPHIAPTFERFDAAPSWLGAFEPSDAEMEGYIVSTVATHDAPKMPRSMSRNEDTLYFSGRPGDWRETVRGQMLSATPERIRELASAFDGFGQDAVSCVVAGAGIIEAEGVPFDRIEKVL